MISSRTSEARESQVESSTSLDFESEHDKFANWTPHFRHGGLHRIIIPAMDVVGTVVSCVGAFLLSFVIVHGWPETVGVVRQSESDITGLIMGLVRLAQSPEFRPYSSIALFSPIIFLLVFQWWGLYRLDSSRVRPFGRTWTVFKGAIAGTAVLAPLGFASLGAATGQPVPGQTFLLFSLNAILVFWVVLLVHSGTMTILVGLRTFGIGKRNVAVIAHGEELLPIEGFLKTLGDNSNLKGIITLGDESIPKEYEQAGRFDELEDCINQHYLDEVVLAIDPGTLSSEDRLVLAQTCWRLGAVLRMVTPFYPYFHTRGRPDVLGGIPLLRVERVGLYSTRPQLVKRTMDIVIAVSALIAASPVMIATAIITKLDSPGPIFFSQERPGLYGRVFRIHKFRSMRQDADPKLHQEAQKKLIKEGSGVLDAQGNVIYGKVSVDPRITRFGHFIRRTSIDELPQLFNVLRGEMSIVGPRPSVLYELENYEDWHMQRLNIRPGITGLWQVSGRSKLTFNQMVELDLKYIEEWSIWLDLWIILRTVPTVLNMARAA